MPKSDQQEPGELFDPPELPEPDRGYTKRGLAWWETQPPTEWLRRFDRFSHRTEDGIRITFRKRQRGENRQPQWNAYVYRRGGRKAKQNYDTVAAVYAKITDNFDLAETVGKVRAQLKSRENENEQVERGEIEPEDTTRPTEEEKREQAAAEERAEREEAGQTTFSDQLDDPNRRAGKRQTEAVGRTEIQRIEHSP